MVGQKSNSKSKQVLKEYIAVVLMALFPFLLLALLFLFLRRSPSEYHLMGSDEMDYWIESATIMKRGLLNQNTGFFGYSWQTHARLLNYGGHGLFSIFPFILLGSFTSWQQSSMMLVNAALISVSIVFSYFMSRSTLKIIANIFNLFLFTAFSLYFVSGMLEALMFAGSMMFAVLLPELFRENGTNKVAFRWFLGLGIAWSLFRLSNIVFLLPLIFWEIHYLNNKWWWVLLKYGLISFILVFVSLLFTAPYPWGFITVLFSSESKLLLFTSHFMENIRLFFRFDQARLIEVVFRLGYLLWMLCLGANLIYSGFKTKNRTFNFFSLIQLMVLISVLLLHLCFYDVGELRDLRVLSPILFFSFATTIFSSFERFWKKYLVAFIIGFLMLTTLLNMIHIKSLKSEFIDPYFDDKRTIDLFKYVRYDQQAADRWQNTVYLDVFNYVWMDFNHYDPGIAVMLPVGGDFESLRLNDVKSTLKAKYLITYRFSSLPEYELIASDDEVYLLQKIED